MASYDLLDWNELLWCLLVTGSKLAPMEREVGNQDGHERDYDNLHSEASLAMAIPGGNGLQDAGAHKGEGHGIRPYHPFAMLLEVTIARSEERGGCNEEPCSSLNDVCGNEVEGVGVAAVVR